MATSETREDEVPSEQLVVRITSTMLRRIERHLVRMRRSTPGVRLKKSDAVRSLLEAALVAAEGREQV